MTAVIPISKNTLPKILSDFCPTSLLPIFFKIFEKIVAQRMMKYISKNKIPSASQFGFRTNSSIELAVTSIYDKLLQNIDDKKVTCSILLDLQKAFDSVDHTIILRKLNHYGFHENTLNFLKSFLENRRICIRSNGTKSNFHNVSHGVR